MSDYKTSKHAAELDESGDGTIWITDILTDETASLEACEAGDLGINSVILGEIYDFYYENGE